MNILRSLTHPPFTLPWAGQITSRLRDSLYRISLSWWVLEKTGSPIAMGTVLVFSQIPMLIFLRILSTWATDRLGTATVFLIGGTATILLACPGLFHPAVHTLD